jgi:hypothetical protein
MKRSKEKKNQIQNIFPLNLVYESHSDRDEANYNDSGYIYVNIQLSMSTINLKSSIVLSSLD